MTRKYPPLTHTTLAPFQALFHYLVTDKEYLNDPSCPYDHDMKLFFKTLQNMAFSPKKEEEAIENIFEDEEDWQVVERQLKKSISSLVKMQERISHDKHKDALDTHKLIASLLERFIGLKERTTNARAADDFMRIVLSIFDQMMTPDQRSLAMERLEEYLPASIRKN